jgi:hypothetical protein
MNLPEFQPYLFNGLWGLQFLAGSFALAVLYTQFTSFGHLGFLSY